MSLSLPWFFLCTMYLFCFVLFCFSKRMRQELGVELRPEFETPDFKLICSRPLVTFFMCAVFLWQISDLIQRTCTWFFSSPRVFCQVITELAHPPHAQGFLSTLILTVSHFKSSCDANTAVNGATGRAPTRRMWIKRSRSHFSFSHIQLKEHHLQEWRRFKRKQIKV